MVCMIEPEIRIYNERGTERVRLCVRAGSYMRDKSVGDQSTMYECDVKQERKGSIITAAKSNDLLGYESMHPPAFTPTPSFRQPLERYHEQNPHNEHKWRAEQGGTLRRAGGRGARA